MLRDDLSERINRVIRGFAVHSFTNVHKQVLLQHENYDLYVALKPKRIRITHSESSHCHNTLADNGETAVPVALVQRFNHKQYQCSLRQHNIYSH